MRSVNPVVGETNDGILNNIRRMAVTKDHVMEAIAKAIAGPVPEGVVGAGTGTICFGWKDGIGTDAPLSDRNLKRFAQRGPAGLARTGASMSNGSGDYVIAFSTVAEVRRTVERRSKVWAYAEVPNDLMSPLFQAAIEATEEAIYNSLCMAETISGYRGVRIEGLPLEKLTEFIQNRKLHQ